VLRGAPFDVFPEFVPPQASVQTEVPGFTLAGGNACHPPAGGGDQRRQRRGTVRSQSIQGLSVIDITFREGSDPYRARQQVSEALADAMAAARRREARA
jgi:Cu/Ag efflux pump CusA